MKSLLVVLGVAAGIALVIVILFVADSGGKSVGSSVGSTDEPATEGQLPIPSAPAHKLRTDGGEFQPHPDRAGFRRPSEMADDPAKSVERP